MVYKCKFGKRLKSGKCPKKKKGKKSAYKKKWIPYEQWVSKNGGKSKGKHSAASLIARYHKNKKLWEKFTPTNAAETAAKNSWAQMTLEDFLLTLQANNGQYHPDKLSECDVSTGRFKGSKGFRYGTAPCFSQFSNTGGKVFNAYAKFKRAEGLATWKKQHPDWSSSGVSDSLTRMLANPGYSGSIAGFG